MKISKLIFIFTILLSVTAAAQVKDYSAIDARIAKMPDSLSQSTALIAKFINANFTAEDDKMRAAFIWTATNISYDVENRYAVNFNETSQNKIDKALLTKKGICIHYAEVLNSIANQCGIQSVIVEGYTKQNGFADYIPHAWCGAKIDGIWYVYDPTWGSGYIDDEKFVQKMNPNYYKARATQIIKSHMPFDYLWQFLNHPVTNQEFYTGKTGIDRTKPFFDYDREIPKYLALSEVDQLIASVERIEKNGIKNGMIFDRVAHKKREIEYLRQSKTIDDFNAIGTRYNQAVNEINEFISFRNKQFKPEKPDAEILRMIADPKQKLTDGLDALGKMTIDAANATNLEMLKTSMARTLKQLEEHEAFVKEYVTKGKLGRKTMFYKRVN